MRALAVKAISGSICKRRWTKGPVGYRPPPPPHLLGRERPCPSLTALFLSDSFSSTASTSGKRASAPAAAPANDPPATRSRSRWSQASPPDMRCRSALQV